MSDLINTLREQAMMDNEDYHEEDYRTKAADLIEQLQQRNAELEMNLDASLELIGQVYSSGINLNELEEPIHEFLVDRRF